MSSQVSEIQSEDSQLISDTEREVEVLSSTQKWNRNDFFIKLNDKTLKCKKCMENETLFSIKVSSNTLKKHVKMNHNLSQTKIDDYYKKKDMSDPRQLLIRFIVNGNHPFSIVEEEDFREFIGNLNSTFTIPSRFTIKRDIIKTFSDYKSKLISTFNKIDSKIAITTDIWTSMTNKPYAAITAHFVGENKKLSHVLIDFCLIPHPHNGEKIKKILLDTFDNYEINGKIVSITSDNAYNNIKGLNLLNEYLVENLKLEDIHHFPCFGHILNLSINDGIKEFESIISNLRQIGSSIKNSSKKSQAYENACKAMDQTFTKLKRDTYIRWNSTFDMIDRGLKMKNVIQIVCLRDANFQPFQISEEQWNKLEMIHKFLSPFYEATTLLSGQDYSSICIVLPFLSMLLDHCKSYANNQTLKQSAKLVEQKLKKYELRLKNKCSYFAVILDPRLNFEYLKSILNKRDYENIRDDFIRKFNDSYSSNETVEEVRESTATTSLLSSIYKKRKLNVNEELENYENLPQEDPKTDPIDWWKLFSNKYPSLSKFAFDILCIPATSVPSEQIFSKAGDLITSDEHRSQILSFKLELL
jgi:hypothetical protein